MVWLIIALVFGVVIGNIMLLKHTAHMKMPSLKQRQQNKTDNKSTPPKP